MAEISSQCFTPGGRECFSASQIWMGLRITWSTYLSVDPNLVGWGWSQTAHFCKFGGDADAALSSKGLGITGKPRVNLVMCLVTASLTAFLESRVCYS